MTEYDRRRQLLDAAIEVFADAGLGAPVSAIAARAGVGMSTFYRWFPSKEALIEELALERLTWVASTWAAALDGEDGWRGFTEALLVFVADLERHPALLASLRASRDDEAPRFAAALAQRDAALRAVLDRAIAEGSLRNDVTTEDIRVVVNAFVGAQIPLEDEEEIRLQRYRLLALLLDGLRAKAKTEDLADAAGLFRSRSLVDG